MIAAIGDIHGELVKLDALLAQLDPRLKPDDLIVFIGDYIDRGPDSRGVIERVIELKESRFVVALRGNHEQMMLDAYRYFHPVQGEKRLDFEFASMWFYNGAHQTLDSYPTSEGSWTQRIPESHWKFVRSTEMEFVYRNYHFVHAGVVPSNFKWTEQVDPRLWIREGFLESKQDFGEIVVFGHTPMKNGQPIFMPNKIGIDTGAVFGGPLTAILIDQHQPYRPEEIEVLQAG